MNEMLEDKEFLKEVFNLSPQPMMIFDKAANIISHNKAAKNFSENGISSSIKASVKEIMESDVLYKRRLNYKRMEADREKEMSVLIKGSVFEYKDIKYVLMAINDLTEIMDANGVVKVCSNCKRIKRTEYSWQDIEVYIKDNLANIQFSHCICPDCSKKLYKNK